MNFSRILFKSFQGHALQNTSLYICSKQVMHSLVKIIHIYVTITSIIKSFSFPNHVLLQTSILFALKKYFFTSIFSPFLIFACYLVLDLDIDIQIYIYIYRCTLHIYRYYIYINVYIHVINWLKNIVIRICCKNIVIKNNCDNVINLFKNIIDKKTL